MKKIFPLLVLPALLVTLGFAQAPTPNSEASQSNSAPAATAPPSEAVSQPDAVAATTVVADSTPSPAAVATPPAPIAAKSAMSALSGTMMISIVVIVLVVGALAPLFSRWRKRKLADETGAQNLSFTHENPVDETKAGKAAAHKAA